MSACPKCKGPMIAGLFGYSKGWCKNECDKPVEIEIELPEPKPAYSLGANPWTWQTPPSAEDILKAIQSIDMDSGDEDITHAVPYDCSDCGASDTYYVDDVAFGATCPCGGSLRKQ